MKCQFYSMIWGLPWVSKAKADGKQAQNRRVFHQLTVGFKRQPSNQIAQDTANDVLKSQRSRAMHSVNIRTPLIGGNEGQRKSKQSTDRAPVSRRLVPCKRRVDERVNRSRRQSDGDGDRGSNSDGGGKNDRSRQVQTQSTHQHGSLQQSSSESAEPVSSRKNGGEAGC